MSDRPPVRGAFEITFSARRFSYYPAWLPFGRVYLGLEKTTTWQDAHEWAKRLADTGVENVVVRFAKDAS